MATIVLKDVNGVKVVRKNVRMEDFPVLEGRWIRILDIKTGEEVGIVYSESDKGK